jgi:hypothetical protein
VSTSEPGRPSPAGALATGDRTCWALGVASFGVGDVATTAVGVGLVGLPEASPVAALAIAHQGLPALAALKVAALAGSYAVWRVVPAPHRVGVPLGLAVLGVAVTAWNLRALAAAVL